MIKDIYQKNEDKITNIDLTNDLDYIIIESGIYNFNIKTKNLKLNIIIKENLEVIINENYFNNLQIDINIEIKDNSKVFYYSCNKDKISKNNHIKLNNNGYLETYFLELGTDNNSKYNIDLLEINSEVNFNLSVYANKSIKQKHMVNINHYAGNTISNVYNYSVLDDYASCDFLVNSYIKKNSKKASVHQKSRVLSLSENCTSNTDPILLIDEFDVVGGHGATFSMVNPNDIYYFKVRGIKEKEAKKLLAIGNLLEHAPIHILEKLQNELEKRLENG